MMLGISFFANAQAFTYIVAADGTGTHTTVQAAIDACPEGLRSIIFIKNGTYNEQVTLGSKTVASTKKISLIGESANGVLITHSQSRASSGSPTFEDICTVKLYATDFYAENISIQNAAGNTGMAEALYTAGDRQTFKNCRILGYQDTYRSKKGTRGYFKNCWIEGAVDFIYAGGALFFDDCTINCVNGGGYIVAPEDAYVTIPKASTVCQKFLRVGFFFRNCNITANADVANNSFYLGRPWNTTAGAFYLNCKLGPHIKAAGWQTMGGNETTASFAEYNSMDLNGNPIDTTKRVSWSFQLPKADVDNLLTPAGVYARVSTTVYDPISLVKAPEAPATLLASGKNLAWTAVSDVAGYVIYKNGQYLANTSSTTFTDATENTGVYTVKSIGTSGQLSEIAATVTAIEEIVDNKISVTVKNSLITFSEPVAVEIIDMDAKIQLTNKQLVQSLNITHFKSGIYIARLTNTDGLVYTQKLIITHK